MQQLYTATHCNHACNTLHYTTLFWINISRIYALRQTHSCGTWTYVMHMALRMSMWLDSYGMHMALRMFIRSAICMNMRSAICMPYESSHIDMRSAIWMFIRSAICMNTRSAIWMNMRSAIYMPYKSSHIDIRSAIWMTYAQVPIHVFTHEWVALRHFFMCEVMTCAVPHEWVPHSYAWHASFICVTWLIQMCDVSLSYAWHDSFICVTWLTCAVPHEWVMSHISYMSHICIYVYICDMNKPFMWHSAGQRNLSMSMKLVSVTSQCQCN